jgi:multiple sugar transport system substrate-binding protein
MAGGTKEPGDSSGAPAGTSEPVSITFWDGNPGPNRTPYYEQVIKWYHEGQDKVELKYVGVPQNQFVDKLNVAVAGKAVPDVVMMSGYQLSGFIAQKAVYKLDDFFNSWNEAKQFTPLAVELARMIDTNGGLYLLPTRSSLNCFWYRIDRFNEAGLKPPVTWDEFFNHIAKLTDPSKGQYGWALRGGSGAWSPLLVILAGYAGSTKFFDENGICFLRDPQVLQIFTRFAGIYNKYTAAGDVNNNYQMMVAAFDSGTANMILHNLGSFDEHRTKLPAGTFGTFMVPKSVKGYYSLTEISYNGYSVMQDSKSIEASIDFLKFLGSEKVVSYLNEVSGEFPSRIDVMNHNWIQTADHMKNVVPILQDLNTKVMPTPQFLPEYNRILTQVAEPGFQAVLLGKTKPDVFLNDWATAFEEAYKRYLENVKK